MLLSASPPQSLAQNKIDASKAGVTSPTRRGMSPHGTTQPHQKPLEHAAARLEPHVAAISLAIRALSRTCRGMSLHGTAESPPLNVGTCRGGNCVEDARCPEGAFCWKDHASNLEEVRSLVIASPQHRCLEEELLRRGKRSSSSRHLQPFSFVTKLRASTMHLHGPSHKVGSSTRQASSTLAMRALSGRHMWRPYTGRRKPHPQTWHVRERTTPRGRHFLRF